MASKLLQKEQQIMAILTPTESFEKITIKVPKSLMSQAEDYMTYAHIESLDELVTKTLNFVFQKDRSFKKKA